jgi:hypothetical protein
MGFTYRPSEWLSASNLAEMLRSDSISRPAQSLGLGENDSDENKGSEKVGVKRRDREQFRLERLTSCETEEPNNFELRNAKFHLSWSDGTMRVNCSCLAAHSLDSSRLSLNRILHDQR